MSKNNIKTVRKKSKRADDKYTDIYTSLNCKLNGQCYKCKKGCSIHPINKNKDYNKNREGF